MSADDVDDVGDDLVTQLFARKRRGGKKGKKAKKRQRSHFDDDGESDHETVALDPETSAAKKKKGNSNGWERVEYKAHTEKPEAVKGKATSERRDTGGTESMKREKGVSVSGFGPRGAPSNLRVTVRMDYQPDVCKDYKETGYCGFGDSCKFLHDRTDYKAGWELERDWVERTRLRNERIMRGEDPDAVVPDVGEGKEKDVDADGLPFACYICRGSFKSPVVTLCAHYFCEACALKRMVRDTTCAVCKTQLRGTLNTAHRLVAKLASDK